MFGGCLIENMSHAGFLETRTLLWIPMGFRELWVIGDPSPVTYSYSSGIWPQDQIRIRTSWLALGGCPKSTYFMFLRLLLPPLLDPKLWHDAEEAPSWRLPPKVVVTGCVCGERTCLGFASFHCEKCACVSEIAWLSRVSQRFPTAALKKAEWWGDNRCIKNWSGP